VALIVLGIRRRSLSTWPIRALSLFLLLSIVWSIGLSLTLWVGLRTEAAEVGLRLAYAMLMVLAVVEVVLTLMFVERPGVKWILIIGGIWLALVFLIAVNLFDVQALLLGLASGPVMTSLIQPLQVAGWAGMSASMFVLVGVDFVQTRGPLHRNRLLFWLLGMAAVVGGQGLVVLNKTLFVIDVNQIGLVVSFGGAILVTVAAINYHLPVLRMFARQALVAVLTTAFLGALIFAGIWIVLNTTQQPISVITIVFAFIAALLLAIFQQPLRVLLQRWVDRIVYRGRYNPARALRDYGDAISNILDLDTLVTVAVGIIAEALDVRRGALLLITDREEGHGVDVQVMQGMGVITADRGELAAGSPILAELRNGEKPLTQYEVDLLPEYRSAPAKERVWLQSLDVEVYVPIRSQSVLIGVFAFGQRESGEPFSAQDLDVLTTVGNQTAAVLQNARLVSDLKGAYRSISQLNDDLTETNRRLEKLDAAKTDFIEIASHELRTPLTQIRGYSDILADMVQQGQIVTAHMNQISGGITRASVRLEQIISAMLDVSRIDSQALDIRTAPMSIAAVVRMALDTYKEAIRDRRMVVHTVELEALPSVQGDLQRLCQAFGNVIGNSIKFTPDGGTITVNGHLLQVANGAEPQAYVEVLITDTGIGIDRNDQHLIFEKFYRVGAVELHSTGSTKFKGAGPGLGLPIAKGIIQAHGGKIWVESPGHNEERMPGSTFHILLPAAAAGQRAAEKHN
jgi:signal transduction histidine kinase